MLSRPLYLPPSLARLLLPPSTSETAEEVNSPRHSFPSFPSFPPLAGSTTQLPPSASPSLLSPRPFYFPTHSLLLSLYLPPTSLAPRRPLSLLRKLLRSFNQSIRSFPLPDGPRNPKKPVLAIFSFIQNRPSLYFLALS
ncbi:hypothetical protein Mapa_000048 [Marchantia paleacea]|nr:hypothetical protein Mapa_000048 [Marchantia paleacea]